MAKNRGKKLRKNVHHTTWPAMATQKDEGTDNMKLAGFIFMCSGKTKPECYINRVFGLPAAKREIVEKIKPGTMLFLFDFDVKLLYGAYMAASEGGMNLEPAAFGGRFSAQVKFSIFKDCLPLPESNFKLAIKDNYQGSKFTPELNPQQVRDLLSLFRPLIAPSASLRPPIPNGAPKPWMPPSASNGWPNPSSVPPSQSLYGPSSASLLHPSVPNAAPEPWMPPPASNGWLNPSSVPPSQSPYGPYRSGPVTPVQQNGLNPHLHHLHPASTYQAPPVPNPHQFAETQRPYLSNELPRTLQEPYPRYTMVPEVYPGGQPVGLNGGYHHSYPMPPNSGSYGQPQAPPPGVSGQVAVSSYYSFTGASQITR